LRSRRFISSFLAFHAGAFVVALTFGNRSIARSYHFIVAVWSAKAAESRRVKYWEIIADDLSKAGWSLGCVSAIDSNGRTIWIAEARRDDGKRFIVRADEKLTAFGNLNRRCSLRDLQQKCQVKPYIKARGYLKFSA